MLMCRCGQEEGKAEVWVFEFRIEMDCLLLLPLMHLLPCCCSPPPCPHACPHGLPLLCLPHALPVCAVVLRLTPQFLLLPSRVPPVHLLCLQACPAGWPGTSCLQMDDSKVVSGDGPSVRLWSHATGRRIATLQGHTGRWQEGVQCVLAACDGDTS